jgi:serine/threonine protein kinase
MAALDVDGDQRASFVRAQAGGVVEVAREVEALLANLDGPFLAKPDAPAPALAPTAGEKPGDRIGNYTLLEPLGEGGFGTVFLARQEHPVRREVAVKIIKPGMDTREVVARFAQERQALALMDHPGIARVLDAGSTPTGRPFFVMDIVRGTPITRACDEARVGIPERLRLLADVCDAVQHAHQKGVIHRDLKPSNVLVQVNSSSALTGRVPAMAPRIIDFGIAKATSGGLGGRTLVTSARQLLGTPEYMSPEQAELALGTAANSAGGNAPDIDTRADIYSLGVILYELMTGHTPLDSATLRTGSLAQIQRILTEEEPLRPSVRVASWRGAGPGTREGSRAEAERIAALRATDPAALARQLKGDLDWIALKCLEKDRTRRYESAGALAADIRRHLADEPVLAMPPSTLYRVGKAVRRHRVGFLAALAVVIAIVTGLGAAIYGLVRMQDEAQKKERALLSEAQERRRADQKAEQAEHLAYRASIAAADTAAYAGDASAALRHLDVAPEPLRGWEWNHVRWLAQRGGAVSAVPVSDAANWALAPDGRVAAINLNSSALWLARLDLGEARRIEKAISYGSMEFSQDQSRLLVSSAAAVTLIDTATAMPIASFPRATKPRYAFNDDGTFLLFRSDSREPMVIDTAGGLERARLTWAGAPTIGARSRDGAMLAAQTAPDVVALFDARTERELWRVAGRWPIVTDRAVLVIEGAAGTKRLLSLAPVDGSLQGAANIADVLEQPNGSVEGLIVPSSDSRLLAVLPGGGAVRVHALPGLELLGTLPSPEGAAAAAFSADSSRVLVLARDGQIASWPSIPAPPALAAQHPPSGQAFAVGFSADGAWAVSGEWGRTTCWDALTGMPRWSRTERLYVTGIDVTEGGHIAMNLERTRVRVVDQSGRLVAERRISSERVPKGGDHTLAWSRGGQSILTTAGFSRLACLDGTDLSTLSEHALPGRIVDISVAHAGRRAAILTVGPAAVFTVALDERGALSSDPRLLPACGGPIALSDDGEHLVCGVTDGAEAQEVAGSLQVLDLERPDAPAVRIETHGPMVGLCWAPDGKRIVLLGADSMSVASPLTGEILLRLRTPGGTSARWARFDTTGQTLLAGSFQYPIIRFETSLPGDEAARWALLRERQMVRLARGPVDAVFGASQLAMWQVTADEARQRIRADRTLDEPVRAVALSILDGLGDFANGLNSAAWDLANAPGRPADRYTRAIELVECALRSAPEDPAYTNTLGVALYRAGLFERALQVLTRSEQLNREQRLAGKSDPGDLAFLAMTCQRLGRGDEAQVFLQRAQAAAQDPLFAKDADTARFLAEATSLLASQ